MQGEQQAILRLAPAPAGSAALNAAQNHAITAASNTAIAIPGATGMCWVTLTPTVACRMRFWSASVGAAISTDRLFGAGETQDYWCGPDITHFSVIRAGSDDGSLSWHRSSP